MDTNKSKQEIKDEARIPVSSMDTWRFFLKYIGTTPYWATTATFLVILASICDVVIPVFSGQIVDALAAGHAGEEGQLPIAIIALAWFISFGLLHRIFWFSSEVIWMQTISKKMYKLVLDAHRKVSRLSTNWHVNSFSGSTVRKITRGKWAFDTFNEAVFSGLLPTVLIFLGISLVQLAHWTIMGWIFIVGFSIYIVLSIVMTMKYAAPANKVFNDKDSDLGGVLADSITCNAIVKSFSAEDREDKYLDKELSVWMQMLRKTWFRFILIGALPDLYLSLLIGGIIALAIISWGQGVYSPGEVSFVIGSCLMIRGYVRNIGNTIRIIQKSINELEDVVRFDKMTLAVFDNSGAEDLNITKGGIIFDDVTFKYENQNKSTYEDFSLEIKPCEKIALIGHSGSGKSTFVKLLQRLYNLDSGHILIDGQDIANVTQASLRHQLSVVSQEPLLFHRSLAENIAYGNPDATQEEIENAAKLAYAHDFISELPKGYATPVGERGIKLSGGERQRVVIARAILADKPILILDEATSSLDSESELLIQKAMESLTKGRTTIIIAHRLSTVRQVDRILVFDKGRIIEQGNHDELISRENGQYRKLLEIQASGFMDL